MQIQKESESLFTQDKEYVIEYLTSRGIKNRQLINYYSKYPFGLLEDAAVNIGGTKHSISHFLSKSDVIGYDIKKVNHLLQLDGTDRIAFAVVLGDDVICYNIKKRKVYLWRVQTGDADEIATSDSLSKIIKSIIER